MAINPVSDIQAQLLGMINLLGTSGMYTITKTGASSTVIGLLSPFDRKDVDLINAYGVGGYRITFQSNSFTQRPAKFDTWVCMGRKYVFDTVVDQLVKGQLVAYTCYIRGTVG